MNQNEYKKIPKEKFKLVQMDEKVFDAKFETKPIGYLKDAWMRFKRNKASVVATYLIGLIILFAAFVPLFSKYDLAYSDATYAKVRPKIQAFERSGFWDGTQRRKLNDKYFVFLAGIGIGAEQYDDSKHITWEEGLKSKYQPIVSMQESFDDGRNVYRFASVDSYYSVGFLYLNVTSDEMEKIKAFEQESGMKIMYPMLDTESKYASVDKLDANLWYKSKRNTPVDDKGKTMSLEETMERGLFDNYLRDDSGKLVYSLPRDMTMHRIRVLYYNYYQFKYGMVPANVFGVDGNGSDIFVRLAHAIRLSLLLSISVSIINFFIGTIYGSITGFYGGWIDLLLERVTDILNGMPFIVLATLFNLHLVKTGKVSVFTGILFAFVLTGWIGIGSRVRTQFYRFKKQEYILAAKTLGAKDPRLMFKHILPNAIGTIITSTALIIPGVILTESALSYLGIISFHGKTSASLGTMLGTAQGFLETDPHILFFPAAVISIMMISFNLFGNGLRDAFNPSLRGVDE